jgi:nucleoside-diphosphate-sugar epimerase
MSALPDAVVVFGASGFIGRNIVDALAGKVTTIIGVTQRTATVPGCTAMTTIDRINALPALPREAVVINVAAVRYDAGTFRADQNAIMRTNVEIAGTVFGFCVARGISEVRLASSIAVYPASQSADADDGKPVDLNDWPHDGEAAYAWSKRWAEICAQVHRRQYGIDTLIFRLSNPYGPYDSTDVAAAHVAPAFVMKALAAGNTFEILGNPDAERDFVFAGDVAATFVASLAARGRSDAFNLGFGATTTVRELAEAALRAAGRSKRIAVSAPPGAGVNTRRVKVQRLHQAFTLPPFSSLDQGMVATTAWYRDALGV